MSLFAKPDALASQSIVPARLGPICGGCKYAELIPQDVTQITCRGVPPVPVVVGVTPQGPAIVCMSPNLPRNHPACALHVQRPALDLNTQTQGEG